MTNRSSVTSLLQPRLTLWDTVSIIVGIIVGTGIFSAPGAVLQNVSGPWAVLGVWTLGGVLSLIGALCFAELASTYPRSGGEYRYLTRAYGPATGFFFAWGQLAVIRTGGSIAAPAFFLGDTAARLWGLEPTTAWLFAAGSILILSLINILGTNPGKSTQNALTIAMVLGVGGIVLAGFLFAQPGARPAPAIVNSEASFALAMVFVLYTYDGWNEAVYVCREVHDGRRNIPLALIVGTLTVTVIYLLVNAAYLYGLGFQGAQEAGEFVHAQTVALALGERGAQVINLLVMVSALGTINGTIFTAARLYAAFGVEHRVFAPLGRWHPRLGTPAFALIVQALISVGMVAGVGIWWKDQKGFDSLVTASAPVFWFFFLLTGLSLFILRRKDPDLERPFRVPLYPLLPLIFCGWCGYMFYGTLTEAQKQEQPLAGVALLLLGVPFYLVSRLLERPQPAIAPPDVAALAEQHKS